MRRFFLYQWICVIPLVALICANVGCRPWIGPGGSGSVTSPQGVSTGIPSVIAGSRQGDTGDTPEKIPLGEQVMIDPELPRPAFPGTPIPLNEPNVREPLGKPRGPFPAPKGTINLAHDAVVTASDPAPSAGELDFVNDGDKEASGNRCLELRPGSEWIQLDLGKQAAIYAVLVWHNHDDARVYRDVIVQVSTSGADFFGPKTAFNNDYDNSSGMGFGSDMGYVETSEGGLIDCKGFEGQYIRLYSNGSTINSKNHYTEVEVYGVPLVE